jgi:hypothetical protein
LLSIVFLRALLPVSFCYGSDNSFQFWPSAGISWEVNNDWMLTYREQLRLNDGGGNLYYGQSNVGVLYKSLADWLDIGANYTVIYGYGKDAANQDETRTSPSAILRCKILEHDVSGRLRI